MDAASKFGSKLEVKQTLPVEIATLSEKQVIEAARRVTGQATASDKTSKLKDTKKQIQVNFSSADLQNFNTAKTTLIKTQVNGNSEEE